MAIATDQICPLCGGAPPSLHFLDPRSGQRYYRCPVCDLVYLSPDDHLDAEAERHRYEQHQNHPGDAGYRKFLSKVLDPLLERLRPGAQGLDFGCGPGPTLSVMFEEKGYSMELFDPFFRPNTEVLKKKYDFIVCTETSEHFRRPRESFALIDSLLAKQGWLGMMTESRDVKRDFGTWYYRNDPTHVAFYSEATFEWLGQYFGWVKEQVHPNVVLYKKN